MGLDLTVSAEYQARVGFGVQADAWPMHGRTCQDFLPGLTIFNWFIRVGEAPDYPPSQSHLVPRRPPGLDAALLVMPLVTRSI